MFQGLLPDVFHLHDAMGSDSAKAVITFIGSLPLDR